MKIAQELLANPVTAHSQVERADLRRYPALIVALVSGNLHFRPAPPGDESTTHPLSLPIRTIEIDAEEQGLEVIRQGLTAGALTHEEVRGALDAVHASPQMRAFVGQDTIDSPKREWTAELAAAHQLDRFAVLAV